MAVSLTHLIIIGAYSATFFPIHFKAVSAVFPTFVKMSPILPIPELISESLIDDIIFPTPRTTAVFALVIPVFIPPVAFLACSLNDLNSLEPVLFISTILSMKSSIEILPVLKFSPSASVVIPIAVATCFS